MFTVFTSDHIVDRGRQVVHAEIAALRAITLGSAFVRAVRLIRDSTGRVIVTGVGKSGIVAQHIAATLTVSGTPAWFIHPTEAMHGDMGRVSANDVLIVVSRGGTTDELTRMVAQCVAWELRTIIITSAPDSVLGRMGTVVLEHGAEEACKFGLTPTSTCTAAAVIGDALALVLQEIKGFGPEEFAAFHQQGALGKRLTCRVEELMLKGEAVGIIAPGQSLLDAMILLAHKRGTLAVCNNGDLVGVITAGDVARYLDGRGQGWEQEPVTTVMTEEAHTTTVDALASNVLVEMEEAGIMAMPVTQWVDLTTMGSSGDETKEVLKGMIHLHDILRAGIT